VARTPCKHGSGSGQQSQTPRAETDCHTNENEKETIYFGDPIGPGDDDHIRVGCINLNNTLQNVEGDERLFTAIYEREIKVLCMQEVGCNWAQIGKENSFQQRLNRMLGPRDARSCFKYNTHDQSGTIRQWGGTGVLCRGKIKHYTMGTGGDPTGLGRWTWARIRGKCGMVLRYVSVYCPCENKTGKIAVWTQQKTYFQIHNDDRDPRRAFMEDLKMHVKQWIKDGDQVLVCGDLNHSVFSRTVVTLFEDLGMSNLIYDKHDAKTAPSTYFLDEEGKIVDGIWGTPGLKATRCGYLRPEEFPGNHSLLWADISYQSALGHNPPRPQTFEARRLQLQDKKCVKRYLDAYRTQIQLYDLPRRQFYLESQTRPNIPLTQGQIQEIEAIDYLKTISMKRAEKQCRKLRKGAVAFSEATIKPIRQIVWWNIAIRRRQGKFVQTTLWERRKKEAGEQELRVSELSVSDMYHRRRMAIKAYRAAKKEHEEHRLKHIKAMPEKERKRILRVERQRKLAQMAKSVNGKLASKSITKIEHEGREYVTKKEIEEVLLPVNESKVRASEHTPFMKSPLVDDFGYRQNGVAHEQVLQGVYDIPEACDKATALVIKGLRRPAADKEGPKYRPRTHITTEDHIRGWKKQRERTAGGLSGLHFGQYKAHAQEVDLAALDASMRSVAYTTGYSFRRWKKGLDVQLLKRTNDHRASQLRTILLMEPDHNMNNKVIGRDAMFAGERLHIHARDNYGGRRGLRAAEVSMNQLLTYNSIWARRGRAVVMSNDAKGCYDRIVHTVVNLALQRLGVPKPALQSMLETIQEMEHHIRTAFGDSEGFYGNDPSKPPQQGILQGSGSGPAGWSAIAAVIVKAMKDEGFGYKVWSLIRQRAITLVCFAFVDDTDLLHANSDRAVTTLQTLEQAQTALNLWEKLLHATGGALAPEKSYWYLVEVVRSKGKWTYARESRQPFEMYLQDGTFKNTRLEVYQAKQSLGIMSRPDGKMVDEVRKLKQAAGLWCDGVRTKRLHPAEAWYSLTATILRTLEYPLVATTLTRTQCKEILKPILKTALPLCKIQRRMPRALVHGSFRTRGLNIPDLYWTQLIQHVHSIQRHMHRDTPSRDLHTENMDLVQFHVGSSVTFWELPFEEYGALAPDGWMKHTWEALALTQLTLKGPDLGLPNERRRDASLMDAFVAQGYDSKKLTVLNECRFYLGASHVSHIATACGSRIDKRCWQGKQHRSDMRPKLIHTFRPTKKDWEIWQEAVRETFLLPNVQHLRLRQALGPWLQKSSATWKWWKSPTTRTLYERNEDGTWRKWVRTHRRFPQDKFMSPSGIDAIFVPSNLIRASVKLGDKSSYVTVTSTGSAEEEDTTCVRQDTLQERIGQLPETAKWAIQHLEVTDNGEAIAAAIKEGTAIAACDAGLKFGLGTAAYVLEGRNKEGRVRGVNKVPGPIKEGDSHRCEMSGIYAVIVLVKEICALHQIGQGSIRVYCDNETALEIFDVEYLPNPKYKNFDLASACWSLKNSVPIVWESEHVKGHQDTTVPYQMLSRQAQLNVEMDKVAGAYWIHLVTTAATMPIPRVHKVFGEEWQLWNGDFKISSPADSVLYSIFQDPQTDMWWRREGHVSDAAYEVIDYSATEDVMRSLNESQRKYVTKSASENYGVGQTLLEWKHQRDAKCPRCQELVETSKHVQRCQGYSADAVFQKNINKVQEFLTEEQTRPDVQDAIIQCVKRWRTQEPIKLADYQPDVQDVIRQQHTIGWLDMMECLPAKGWRQLQRRYYEENNLRKSSKKWIKGVLRQLFFLGHKQWKHRCEVKANITKPQEQEHVDLMHDEIERQFVQGSEELLPGDKSILDYSILNLLRRSLAYKKGWLTRIWAARQRAIRIAKRNDELCVQSKEAARIVQWMKTHKDRPRWKERKRRSLIPDTAMEDAPADKDYVNDQEYLRSSVDEEMKQCEEALGLENDVVMEEQVRQPSDQSFEGHQGSPGEKFDYHFHLCASSDRL
jgi:exonuclease III